MWPLRFNYFLKGQHGEVSRIGFGQGGLIFTVVRFHIDEALQVALWALQ
jgi:hypothetical protein